MPFTSSARGAYGPQGKRIIKGPLAPVWVTFSPGAVGTSAFSYTFVATDDSGDAPTYSVASGALPTGLTLNPTTGVLSGTATVSGTYTYTLRATDVNGRTTDTTSISQVVTLAAPPGGDLYQTAGTYTWVAPTGVTSVHVVAIGGGGGGATGNTGNAGAGGGLGWRNNIAVVPGTGYTVVVGNGASGRVEGTNQGFDGGVSYFINTSTVAGYGGQGGSQSPDTGVGGTCYDPQGGGRVGDGGGNGGNGGYECNNVSGPGGGGAGGYSGNGGRGSTGNNGSGQSGAGGGGGAGGNGGGGSCFDGGGGGGVGVYGEGASGGGGGNGGSGGFGGGGGSGGGGGEQAGTSCYSFAGDGGAYGGGGGGTNDGQSASQRNPRSGDGGRGAVRIIWGASRAFPSTNVGLNYGVGTITGATNEVTRA